MITQISPEYNPMLFQSQLLVSEVQNLSTPPVSLDIPQSDVWLRLISEWDDIIKCTTSHQINQILRLKEEIRRTNNQKLATETKVEPLPFTLENTDNFHPSEFNLKNKKFYSVFHQCTFNLGNLKKIMPKSVPGNINWRAREIQKRCNY